MALSQMFSQRFGYATHALGYLARKPIGELTTLAELAEWMRSIWPSASDTYLSNVIQRLTRGGILRSHRGTAGGYSLARPADQISLRRVAEVIDGVPQERCALSLEPTCPVVGRCHVPFSEGGVKIGVVHIQGNVFMHTPADNPFKAADDALAAIHKETKIAVIDMHCEATSEKIAMGWHTDGRASFVFGTHTHVQTSDERVLPKGTAARVDRTTWRVPALFRWLGESGRVPEYDLRRSLNMGIGLILVVDKSNAEAVRADLLRAGEANSVVIGDIVAGEPEVKYV